MSYIHEIMNSHIEGRMNNGDRLWTLINVELWCRKFIDGDPNDHDLEVLTERAIEGA